MSKAKLTIRFLEETCIKTSPKAKFLSLSPCQILYPLIIFSHLSLSFCESGDAIVVNHGGQLCSVQIQLGDKQRENLESVEGGCFYAVPAYFHISLVS